MTTRRVVHVGSQYSSVQRPRYWTRTMKTCEEFTRMTK